MEDGMIFANIEEDEPIEPPVKEIFGIPVSFDDEVVDYDELRRVA